MLGYKIRNKENNLIRREKASSWPLDPDGQYIYPEIYKGISASRKSGLMLSGKDFSWRIDIKKAISFAESKIKSKISFDEIGLEPKGIRPAEPKLYGDLIIARKDIPTSYHPVSYTHLTLPTILLV